MDFFLKLLAVFFYFLAFAGIILFVDLIFTRESILLKVLPKIPETFKVIILIIALFLSLSMATSLSKVTCRKD